MTSFFRDAEAFEALTECIGELIESRGTEGNRIFRVWVVGCSTGEEAYSLGIILSELMDRLHRYLDWQIFATDLDADAIQTARQGRYPEGIKADVTSERLMKFFTFKEGQYLVNREIRERVIFSVHDVTSEPPFSRIDLISTRNLLIYLNSEMQQKIIPLFHYALNDGAILFLGSAETIGELSDHFTVLNRKWRIYKARKQGVRLPVEMPHTLYSPSSGPPAAPGGGAYTVAVQQAEKDLLKALPPSVLIDESGQVLYVHGDTWKYLQLAEGRLSNSIMEMAREGIKTTLGSAINGVLSGGEKVVREGARSKINGETLGVKITVKPVAGPRPGPRKLAVTFEDVPGPGKRRGKKDASSEADGRIKELEQELQFTRENLRSTVEELETANEELRSANEEYQSSNEELQSTNEELETSREELQSVNEELVTVNSEHQKKIEELSTVNDDMQNLLNSSNIATIFLDENLAIKRYTPAATEILNLIDVDVGRPLSHITSHLKTDTLSSAAKQVLNTLMPTVENVETKDGRGFSLRINPYRTRDNKIAGVVISLTDLADRQHVPGEKGGSATVRKKNVGTPGKPGK